MEMEKKVRSVCEEADGRLVTSAHSLQKEGVEEKSREYIQYAPNAKRGRRTDKGTPKGEYRTRENFMKRAQNRAKEVHNHEDIGQ